MEKLHSAAGPGGQDGKTQRKGLKPAEPKHSNAQMYSDSEDDES